MDMKLLRSRDCDGCDRRRQVISFTVRARRHRTTEVQLCLCCCMDLLATHIGKTLHRPQKEKQ
jgi:hypothetical protein